MSAKDFLPYYPLTNDGVRDAYKINADLAALYTGIAAGIGATGLPGPTGIRGVTGLANWIEEATFPTGMDVPILLWSLTDEALYAFCTGPDRWVQISAGAAAGATGLRGPTGLANWMEEAYFPTGMAEPVLLWNFDDEALYAFCTGPDRWVQISAGAAAGSTGVHGPTGLANWMEEAYFPTGMDVPILLWNFTDEALYGFCTGPDRWVQISAGATIGATGIAGVNGATGLLGETGIQGTAGAAGATGAQGASGLQGAAGGVTGILSFILNSVDVVCPTGLVGDIKLPFDMSIDEWTLTCSPTGTVRAALWVDTYANYPPTSADSMHGDTGPYINAGAKNTSTTTGWTGAGGYLMRVMLTGNDLATQISLTTSYKRL